MRLTEPMWGFRPRIWAVCKEARRVVAAGTFNAPSPLTIANGRIQGKWGDGTFDGQVNPDGKVRMKTQPFAGLFAHRQPDDHRALPGRLQLRSELAQEVAYLVGDEAMYRATK